MNDYLQIARQVMQEQHRPREVTKEQNKPQEVTKEQHQPQEYEPMEDVLKGKAVELWSDALGERFWLVADGEDAAKLGEPRGTVYTAAEARRVIRIGDPATVAELHEWKRRFDGIIR